MGIKGYKAFDSNFRGRGKQYAENTRFEEDLFPEVFEQGIHFSTLPHSFLLTYSFMDICCPMIEPNIFCRVEANGDVDIDKDLDIIATNDLTVKDRISLKDFIMMCEETYDYENDDINFYTAPYADLQKQGYHTSHQIEVCTGEGTLLTTQDFMSEIISIGEGSIISATGDDNVIVNCGTNGLIKNSGNHCKIYTDSYSVIKDNGEGSIIHTKGDEVIIKSNGNTGIILAEGDESEITCSGNNMVISAPGKDNHIICGGRYCRVKAGLGSQIIFINNRTGHTEVLTIDNKGYKENTGYMLNMESDEIEEVEIYEWL